MLFSRDAFAHAYLKESNPKNGELLTESIQQITLNFETKIENISMIEAFNSNEEQVDLGNFIIEDSENLGYIPATIKD
ncbi:copper resistance CopC family protein [Virgibacillus sp. FSP13]